MPRVGISRRYQIKEPLPKPRSKREFAAMLYNLFGLKLPSVAVCKGHSDPLSVLWKIYNQEYPTAVVVAARKSGKTLGIAALQVLYALTYNNLRSVDVAATRKQASVCFEHSRNLIFKPQGKLGHVIKQFVVDEGTKENITLATGSSIGITTGNMEGVNAIHPHKLFIDEVELGDWNVIQEALLAPVSEGNIKRLVAFVSSWKFRGGNVDRLINTYQNDPEALIAYWCSFEVMQPVPDCSFCFGLKRTLADGRVISFADFAHENGECKARKARGFMPLSDVRRNFMEIDEQVFRAQWLTQQPQGSGLAVFYLHNTSKLKKFNPLPGYPVVVGVDFGKISACIFVQIVPPGWMVVFEEDIQYNMSPYELAQKCLDWDRKLRAQGIPVDAWVIDPRSYYALQKDFLSVGLIATTPWTPSSSYMTEKKNRVNIVNSYLVPSGDLGLPRLYIVEGRAPQLIRQMSEMTYKVDKDGMPTDDLPDRDDHSTDALLYAISYIYGTDLIEDVATTGREDARKIVATILEQVSQAEKDEGRDPTDGELFAPPPSNEIESEIISALTEHLNSVASEVMARATRDLKLNKSPTEIANRVIEESKDAIHDWLKENKDMFSEQQYQLMENIIHNMPPELEKKLLEITVRELDRAMMTPSVFGPVNNPIVQLYEQIFMNALSFGDYPWLELTGSPWGLPPVGGMLPPLPF